MNILKFIDSCDIRELFAARYEDLDEVKDKIQKIMATSVSDEFAKKSFGNWFLL